MISQLDAGQAFEFYRTFLEWYASWARPRYLEIGCNRGENLWRLHEYCPELWGVDTEWFGDWGDHVGKFPRINYYQGTSDEFFNIYYHLKWDLVFIDGCHDAEQVLKDITNSLACLNEHGLIVCHDTYPPSESHTGPMASGTAFQAICEVQARMSHMVQVYTFPVTFGVTLISRFPVLSWLPKLSAQLNELADAHAS